jgi:4-hydroxy-3-methylbut-2-enyl diphosphate reductase
MPGGRKKTLQIEKASELGFCFGVRHAIRTLEKAIDAHKQLSTLGPIVHNKQVVNKLAQKGVRVIDDISQVEGESVVLSSHGVPPQLLRQIEDRGLSIIDTTCANVRHAQKAAQALSRDGFRVIIFGEAAHPEVKGLLGWAGADAVATLHISDLEKAKFSRKLGILSQTTQGQLPFEQFIEGVIDLTFPQLEELRVVNTLCNETRKRQEAALRLAGKSDLVLVVGGLNSANTRHLAEICSPIVQTHHIENADEIQSDWLKGRQRIGITAGASTPDEAIDAVIARLRAIDASS